MSNFFQSKTGIPLDGSHELAHYKERPTIPNDTLVTVSIINFELVSPMPRGDGSKEDGIDYYQAYYEILDKEYQGVTIKHKIKCFSLEDKVHDKALNILIRLFNLCNVKVPQDEPTEADWFQLIGKIIIVKVGLFVTADKKNINFVKEIQPADGSFKKESPAINHPVSALQRISGMSAYSKDNKKSGLEDDIPF